MTLVIAGNHRRVNLQPSSQPESGPRDDVSELALRLGMTDAQTIPPSAYGSGWMRWFEDKVKLDFREAFSASGRLAGSRAVVSMSERVAIPLETALWLRRIRIPHVVIAHKLSSGLKRSLLRIWPLHQRFSRLVCLSRAQAAYATRELGMDPARVEFVPSNVDQRFFCPLAVPQEDFVLAVGNEQRDYPTLLQALAGTGLKLTIVASSPWSNRQVSFSQSADLTLLKNLSWPELRRLYASARLVVVPLSAADYAAGVTGVLEAMAMGKPVIASQSPGLAGYITDGTDGRWTPVSDPGQMRQAILELWESPVERARLAGNARQAVEMHFSLDVYLDRVARIVDQASGAVQPASSQQAK